jgi:hypothetical protein
MKPFIAQIFLLSLLLAPALADGQFACRYTGYFTSCTAADAGASCTPNNYLTGGKCIARKYYIHSCISWLSGTSELKTDSGCQACADGMRVFVNQTYVESSSGVKVTIFFWNF